jgi:hypothetical protein
VSEYLAGDGVPVVIATEPHRAALAAALGERTDAIWLDAAETLGGFRRNGRIDRAAFGAVVGDVVRGAVASGRPVRAFGEMVALLWEAGEVVEAIELERLWNDLARELPFALFCAYPALVFATAGHAEALRQVCGLHTSVLSPPIEVAATYPPDVESPGRARRDVVAALKRAGLGGVLLIDAALVVGELTANAVVHAASSFSIVVRRHDTALRVAVTDAATPGDNAAMHVQRSHGLGLIESIASRWGVEPTATGKVVWAELPI